MDRILSTSRVKLVFEKSDKIVMPSPNNPKNILGTFDGRTHFYPVHIFYEDTDFSGVVYHANYLRFLERARSSFLNLLGITHANLWDEHRLAFTIRKISIDYKSPAKVDDHLIIHTTYDHLKGARLLISQSCYRENTLIVKADIEAACITASGKPVRSPGFLKNKLAPYLLGSS